jgi:hypothetical protein
MKLVPYYSDEFEESGIGIIESFREENGDTLLIIRKKECITEISKICCNFEPKIGDKVQLRFDSDDEIKGWVIVKCPYIKEENHA